MGPVITVAALLAREKVVESLITFLSMVPTVVQSFIHLVADWRGWRAYILKWEAGVVCGGYHNHRSGLFSRLEQTT